MFIYCGLGTYISATTISYEFILMVLITIIFIYNIRFIKVCHALIIIGYLCHHTDNKDDDDHHHSQHHHHHHMMMMMVIISNIGNGRHDD